ncbi:hypothetical protein IAU60_001208 [Kwoniella sp. DSM 27419]
MQPPRRTSADPPDAPLPRDILVRPFASDIPNLDLVTLVQTCHNVRLAREHLEAFLSACRVGHHGHLEWTPPAKAFVAYMDQLNAEVRRRKDQDKVGPASAALDRDKTIRRQLSGYSPSLSKSVLVAELQFQLGYLLDPLVEEADTDRWNRHPVGGGHSQRFINFTDAMVVRGGHNGLADTPQHLVKALTTAISAARDWNDFCRHSGVQLSHSGWFRLNRYLRRRRGCPTVTRDMSTDAMGRFLLGKDMDPGLVATLDRIMDESGLFTQRNRPAVAIPPSRTYPEKVHQAVFGDDDGAGLIQSYKDRFVDLAQGQGQYQWNPEVPRGQADPIDWEKTQRDCEEAVHQALQEFNDSPSLRTKLNEAEYAFHLIGDKREEMVDSRWNLGHAIATVTHDKLQGYLRRALKLLGRLHMLSLMAGVGSHPAAFSLLFNTVTWKLVHILTRLQDSGAPTRESVVVASAISQVVDLTRQSVVSMAHACHKFPVPRPAYARKDSLHAALRANGNTCDHHACRNWLDFPDFDERLDADKQLLEELNGKLLPGTRSSILRNVSGYITLAMIDLGGVRRKSTMPCPDICHNYGPDPRWHACCLNVWRFCHRNCRYSWGKASFGAGV